MWKQDISQPNLCVQSDGGFVLRGYRQMPGGWINADIEQLEQGNEIWQDTVFQGRAVDPFSTTGVETEMLKMKLGRFLTSFDVAEDAIVMDAGCADGRITRSLLDAGVQRIVSTDLDQGGVQRLVTSLDAAQLEKVLVIVDDFNQLPIADGAIDVIVAFALFSHMSDFRLGVCNAVRMLKPGGLLFCANPVLEHALIYALVRNDIDEFLQVARTSTRARMWDQKDRRYRVYSVDEVEQLLEHPSLETVERDGINILPSLVFGGVLQDQRVDADKNQELRDMILALSAQDLRIHRQAIHICRKRHIG